MPFLHSKKGSTVLMEAMLLKCFASLLKRVYSFNGGNAVRVLCFHSKKGSMILMEAMLLKCFASLLKRVYSFNGGNAVRVLCLPSKRCLL